MSIFSDFFKKEAPLLGLQGSGGGLGFLVGGGAADVEATGGYVHQAVGEDSHLYKYHIWKTNTPAPLKNFTVGSERTLDVLVVGGGGGGGGYAAGGGGAGGVLYGQLTATEDLTARTVTIGAAGAASTADWGSPGGDGGASSIILNGVTCSAGGGKGGAPAPNSGVPNNVGSAGGGARGGPSPGAGSLSPAPTPGGTLTGYANPSSGGTTNNHPRYSGGGGGGAGGGASLAWNAAYGGTGGASGCFSKFGAGLIGPQFSIPEKSIIGGGAYAAGGGGGKEDSGSPGNQQGGAGGVGGGGMGGFPQGNSAGQDAFNFGCGGGGGGYSHNPPASQAGGSGYAGVVMVRYPMGLAAKNSGAVASGGNAANGLQPGNGYKYHTFTSPGSINFTTGGEIEVLIVAAGGGGADSGACCVGHGGGGAGGILHGVYTISSGTYPVAVGQGQNGDSGQNSSFNGHTAAGGGYGGWYNNSWNQGADGGSGGGGMNTEQGNGEVFCTGPRKGYVTVGTQEPSPTPGVALTGYGSPGGYASQPESPNQSTMTNGGGGGAGGPGQSGTPSRTFSAPDRKGGGGGPGVQFYQFTGPLIGVSPLNPQNGWFGGGGGSGVRNNYPNPGTAGAGGQGGGGNGGAKGNAGNDGQDYTGGGGGGPSGGGSFGATRGGHGIVVIRYKA